MIAAIESKKNLKEYGIPKKSKESLIISPNLPAEESSSFSTKTLTVGTIKESPIASKNPEIINKNDEINVVNL
tara:strand:+ start:56 stop:274 length:219 start_codon:yes stop_codon:yes gene_type:complete